MRKPIIFAAVAALLVAPAMAQQFLTPNQLENLDLQGHCRVVDDLPAGACTLTSEPECRAYQTGSELRFYTCQASAWTVTDTVDLSDINTFAELNAIVADKTLVNEEDAANFKQLNSVYYMDQYASGGTGTIGDPYTGWEATLSGSRKVFVFPSLVGGGAAYYETASELQIGNYSIMYGYGEFNTYIVAAAGLADDDTDGVIAVLNLGGDNNVFSTRAENMTIDCGGVASSVGVYAKGLNEGSGLFNVGVRDCRDHGVWVYYDAGAGGAAGQMFTMKSVRVMAADDADTDYIGMELDANGSMWHHVGGLSFDVLGGGSVPGGGSKCMLIHGTKGPLIGVQCEDHSSGVNLGVGGGKTASDTTLIGMQCTTNAVDPCVNIANLSQEIFISGMRSTGTGDAIVDNYRSYTASGPANIDLYWSQNLDTPHEIQAGSDIGTDNCVRIGDADSDAGSSCLCRNSLDQLYEDRDCGETFTAGDKILELDRDRPLDPTASHTIGILGDSLAVGTPYAAIPSASVVWPLQNMLAADSDYTVTTGADLIPASCTGWSVTNGTCSNGDLTITTSEATWGYYRGRASYSPETSPNGIDISANPTDRYLLSFEVDVGALNSSYGPPADGTYGISAGAGTGDLDFLTVEVEAIGAGYCDTGFEEFFNLHSSDGRGGTGTAENLITFADAPWSKYYMVLDPTEWDVTGTNHSTDFGNSDCRIRVLFNIETEVTDASAVVRIRNINMLRLTKSTRVIEWGRGAQIAAGMREDDYPTLTSAYSSVDALVLMIGRNDYDGQAGTASEAYLSDDCTAADVPYDCCDGADSGCVVSFIQMYFGALEDIKADADTDGIDPVVKVLTYPSTHSAGGAGGSWGNTNIENNEAWRISQRAERKWLRDNNWYWIDPAPWYEHSREMALNNVLIDGDEIDADLDSSGTAEEFPAMVTPINETGKISYFRIVSTVSTTSVDADSSGTCNAGDDCYCFNVRNLTDGTDLMSADTCTTATELTADTPYLLSLDQNNTVDNDLEIIALEMKRTGAPTALTDEWLLVQPGFEGQYHNAYSSFMWDDQHPGQLAYYMTAEAVYELLTGKNKDGVR